MKSMCDFVAETKPMISGLINTISIPVNSSTDKSSIEAFFAAILQSRETETKGIFVDAEVSPWAAREVLRPWAQGLSLNHELIGALSEIVADEENASDSVDAVAYFGNSLKDRISAAEQLLHDGDLMARYNKNCIKDINHLILRLLEQTKIKMTDNAYKITVLETAFAEKEKSERENRERMIMNRVVEVKDDYLQSLLRDKTRLEETQKALQTEKENVLKQKEEIDDLVLEVAVCERKLMEIPELKKKLEYNNSIQADTTINLMKVTRAYEDIAASIFPREEAIRVLTATNADLHTQLNDKAESIVRLNVEMEGLEELLQSANNEIKIMKEQEFSRMNLLQDVGCQHTLDPQYFVESAVQTEFLFPPVSISHL